MSVLRTASSSWLHVTGWFMSSPAFWATDLRYQSNWVFAQKGTATTLPSHWAPRLAPSTTSSERDAFCSASGTGARKPGFASSGT